MRNRHIFMAAFSVAAFTSFNSANANQTPSNTYEARVRLCKLRRVENPG
jgi:hypothetical protein